MNKRKAVILQTMDLLQKGRFNISIPDTRSSCFDLLARRGSFILLSKFLLNIDSVSEEMARDLKVLSNLISAHPILIGERTRHLIMQDGVLYSRYGINAVTFRTFSDVLSEDLYPVACSSRGGFYVKLDGQKLKKLRIEANISVGELADEIGVSRTMIYSYENDVFGATLSTVFKLEEFLDESLARRIDVFEIPDLPDRVESFERQKPGVFLKLEEIGFEIHPMKKAFFDAITRGEEEGSFSSCLLQRIHNYRFPEP
jgi:putative transcriptional regulator